MKRITFLLLTIFFFVFPAHAGETKFSYEPIVLDQGGTTYYAVPTSGKEPGEVIREVCTLHSLDVTACIKESTVQPRLCPSGHVCIASALVELPAQKAREPARAAFPAVTSAPTPRRLVPLPSPSASELRNARGRITQLEEQVGQLAVTNTELSAREHDLNNKVSRLQGLVQEARENRDTWKERSENLERELNLFQPFTYGVVHGKILGEWSAWLEPFMPFSPNWLIWIGLSLGTFFLPHIVLVMLLVGVVMVLVGMTKRTRGIHRKRQHKTATPTNPTPEGSGPPPNNGGGKSDRNSSPDATGATGTDRSSDRSQRGDDTAQAEAGEVPQHGTTEDDRLLSAEVAFGQMLAGPPPSLDEATGKRGSADIVEFPSSLSSLTLTEGSDDEETGAERLPDGVFWSEEMGRFYYRIPSDAFEGACPEEESRVLGLEEVQERRDAPAMYRPLSRDKCKPVPLHEVGNAVRADSTWRNHIEWLTESKLKQLEAAE